VQTICWVKEKAMQTIKGKYNQANVMIDTLDEATRSQIQGFVNNPSFHGSYIAARLSCRIWFVHRLHHADER
jgi:NAD-specific glutamate dehydrogenase